MDEHVDKVISNAGAIMAKKLGTNYCSQCGQNKGPQDFGLGKLVCDECYYTEQVRDFKVPEIPEEYLNDGDTVLIA